MEKLLKIIFAVTVIAVVASCGSSDTGQLVGVFDRPAWKGINPYGMVYVPSGTLHIGQSDQDVQNTFVQRPMSISIQGFYMDDTEITNNEYRQFVYWVRDSIAHSYLDHYIEDDDGNQRIDWEYEVDWTDETLDDLYYQGDDQFAGKKEMNTAKFEFEYEWYDWKRAAHANSNWQETQTEGGPARNSFINRETVNIYPDTLCWVRDYAYSYNEPMTRNYFWHPAFDDYPVVGVNWKVANAFCYWRSKIWDTYQSQRKDGVNTEVFRLPTELSLIHI